MANTTIDILFHATRIRRVSEQIAAITFVDYRRIG